MTREEARHWLEIELKTWEDECKSKHPIKEALSVAIEALEQEPILDKIREEIEKQEKWLLQAGYNEYNVDIAFSSIKSVLAESEKT